VAKAVADYVRTRARELGTVAVNLTLSVEQATLVTSAGATRLEVTGGTAPWTDEQTLQVAFVDRKGQRQVLDVVCSAKQLPRVVAPKANLSRGHIIRPEDVDWKQLEAGDNVADFAVQIEQVVGQETKRAFRAGESFTVADLRGVPLIKRGDIVTVVARSRGITVRMDAKSRGDGSLGQQVNVVSLDGRRELSVRVTGFHEAAVIAGSEPSPQQDSGTGLRLVTSEK
jgi:flagella basal body P-ring formation protein FlgA